MSSIFRQGETGYFHSGETLIEAGKLLRYVYQLRTGLAYQSHEFPDGRRAIVDLFTPGNVVGLETILSLRASGTVTAAGPVRSPPDSAKLTMLMAVLTVSVREASRTVPEPEMAPSGELVKVASFEKRKEPPERRMRPWLLTALWEKSK